MINIAVCDDDITTTTYIEELISNISNTNNIHVSCDVFFDGTTLLKHISQNIYYDLIYLDIEMKHVNGIDAATQLRNMNIPSLIIYVSGYEQYLKKLFNTEPFRYLQKPIDKDTFNEFFLAAYKRLSEKSEYFTYNYNKSITKIPLNEITYFESQYRVVRIHTAPTQSNTIFDAKFYGKINDIEKELSTSNHHFIRIHQSFLVNFDYIRSINFTSVTMTDGTILQISEERQKKVRTLFCTIAGTNQNT